VRRLIIAAVAVVSTLVPATAASETLSWPAYGHDTELTNDVASSSITRSNASALKLAWSDKLDGAVIASPLSVRVRFGMRAPRQLVFVATEGGSVYALTAATGAIVWQRTFPTTKTSACGTFGFSSTGAIDLRRRLLYVAAADGWVHALDLATGAEAPHWPMQLLDRPSVEYVWGGLQLIGGRLYVPVASYCDEPDPHGVAAEGRIVAVDPGTAAVTARFDTVPGFGNLGGVWGWGGVAAAPDGSVLYTGVGNSWVMSAACGCQIDDAGYGDKLVALTPDLSTVLASNKPADVPPQGDQDFGAAPLVFQPNGCPPLVAAKNKLGHLYVWDRTRIGDGPIADFPLGDAKAAFVGAPSYDAARGTFFVSQVTVHGRGTGYGIAAFAAGPSCALHQIWRSTIGAGNEPPPLVVGDIVFDARGSTGGFGALSAVNGHQLWSFATSAQTISPLIEVGGELVGGDVDGTVYAFRPPSRSPRVRHGQRRPRV
jgi:outer membrane protein assembly factor BamB